MSITFYRRRKLGKGSVSGMRTFLSEMDINNAVAHSWTGNTLGTVEEENLLIRWGCTAHPITPHTKVLNQPSAIHRVNDKKGFRVLLREQAPHIIPSTIITHDELTTYPLIVRPKHHAQGNHLWVVNNFQELVNVTSQLPEWYASELIDKKQEFRVYIVSGRVVTVAEKTPDDPTQVAWNVAQGGRFDVVNWGDWNLNVCTTAIEAFKHSGLDFGGVDVMTDQEGHPYVIEINSAPSLPMLSNGSVSYRQQCMAKAFAYIHNNNNGWIEPTGQAHWRDVIHPAIWSNGND